MGLSRLIDQRFHHRLGATGLADLPRCSVEGRISGEFTEATQAEVSLALATTTTTTTTTAAGSEQAWPDYPSAEH